MRRLTARSVAMFEGWHSSSSVRSRPCTYIFTESDFTRSVPSLWFPAALSSALAHESVRALSEKELLVMHVYHLVYFMDYTTELEMSHVNEAVQCMVVGGLSKYFDDEERRIALKIYTDEGYHALFSREIADQVAKHFDVVRIRSARIERLDNILKNSPSGLSCFTRFCIGFVSETLIARELLRLSRNSLVGPVASMLKDHLHDEGRHAVFFSECFARLWLRIPKREKDYVVQTLVKVLTAFCRPDVRFLQMLFNKQRVIGDEVVTDLEKNWVSRMIEICGPTLRAIERTDLLEDEVYFLQFKSAGLVG